MTEPQERLAELLLEVAGRGPTNMYVARREARALAAGMKWMTHDQQTRARATIRRLETRWGSLLEGSAEKEETSSETEFVQLIARWLSRKRNPARILIVLHRAAKALEARDMTLPEMMEEAYKGETDRVWNLPSYQIWRGWMNSLRFAVKPHGAGHWIPGVNHDHFMKEWSEPPVDPLAPHGITNAPEDWTAAGRLGPLYAASLAEMVKLKTRRR